ncbi:hypothetical protein JOD54_000962 [Actinokineospora baliensis]|uniref:DUF2075 domain-containing protein n=1 Tax=Actinokineospora baliensis TaxID=547056 RepID=UPI00195779F7|nr:DUF2075 domain-containing protein [Actinokineospora baliensis]MBM7770758.1 hypothetical protein [Actinokineospora baliensis]
MTQRCLVRRTAALLDAADRNGLLGATLAAAYSERYGKPPTANERASWEECIPTIIGPLLQAGLGDIEVLLELKHPLSSSRMDMVLVGSRPGKPEQLAAVVVVNKRWPEAEAVPDSNMVRLPTLRHVPDQVHPSNQVWSYCLALTSYVSVLAEADVYGLVNLPSAPTADIKGILAMDDELDRDAVSRVRVFPQDDRAGLRGFLTGVLATAEAARHADELIRSPRRPTRHLMSAVAECVRERAVFPLLDEQRKVCDEVHRLVRASMSGNRKKVIIVKGSAGTGKSVIALELLGSLNRQGVSAVHATGSDAFTGTLRANLGTTKKRAALAFTYYFHHARSDPNDIDVLIADEAHRIRATSNSRWTKRTMRSTAPQIEELINVARVPVFLLDDNQVICTGEVGSIEMISDAAARLGCEVEVFTLDHQFRCGGSDEYLRWVDRLFGITAGGPLPWRPLEDYTLYLAPDPAAMERYLRDRTTDEETGRITAGYCWKWSKELAPNGRLHDDVTIGGWARPWNARQAVGTDRSSPDYIPPSTLWATHRNGFGQVGCIYTAQGFEYDHSGVIIGPDLIAGSNGSFQVNPKANVDFKLRGAPDKGRLIRNTYRVLATRGIQSTVLYSTDRATREMLHELGIPPLPEHRLVHANTAVPISVSGEERGRPLAVAHHTQTVKPRQRPV